MPSDVCSDPRVSWLLLYTKPHAEAWTEINLRKQGFVPLLPRVASRSGVVPLFPRYVFAGYRAFHCTTALRSTRGVQYVVQCGDRPAHVAVEVIAEIRSRMNENGVVPLERASPADPLFAKRQSERVRALVKLAQAGFRVKSA